MGILIWVFSMHSKNRQISRQASLIKSAHSEQCVTSKCYLSSIPINREMAKQLMVDHCNTFTSRNGLRFPFFRIIFKEVFGQKNKMNEYSKTTKKLSKFLSHIKATWLKILINYTFTKFSKSLHISFNGLWFVKIFYMYNYSPHFCDLQTRK